METRGKTTTTASEDLYWTTQKAKLWAEIQSDPGKPHFLLQSETFPLARAHAPLITLELLMGHPFLGSPGKNGDGYLGLPGTPLAWLFQPQADPKCWSLLGLAFPAGLEITPGDFGAFPSAV